MSVEEAPGNGNAALTEEIVEEDGLPPAEAAEVAEEVEEIEETPVEEAPVVDAPAEPRVNIQATIDRIVEDARKRVARGEEKGRDMDSTLAGWIVRLADSQLPEAIYVAVRAMAAEREANLTGGEIARRHTMAARIGAGKYDVTE